MSNAFEIKNGVLEKYSGTDADVVIPSGVTTIGAFAFEECTSLVSVAIPDGVTAIEESAFQDCKNLTSISIPEGVTSVGDWAFEGCTSLASVDIPNSVATIGEWAFAHCKSLSSVDIPEDMTGIKDFAFGFCENLTSIVIPANVTEIGESVFDGCSQLTVICSEGSEAHRYCLEYMLTSIFDYQHKAFDGLLPQGFERLASPFLADEEAPYVFISYSHKDRDEVLPVIKKLYESGWKIWYDEGLTIGDRYDETLKEHVKNCSAFLLFVSENSLGSYYVKENEIPWATGFGKPIIKCLFNGEKDYPITGDRVIATVPPAGIEQALQEVSGLSKGERRVAKGISVIVNLAERDAPVSDGFAYCLYSESDVMAAKAIMHDATDGGCVLYDAVENGRDEHKLQSCACLIVFLNKEFLSDEYLKTTLIQAYRAGRDIAVCLLEDIVDEDLPQELVGLHLMQWLNYAFGINADMNTKLQRHLQKRGCRNAAVLPGFEYERTAEGIVITKYTGMNPNPRIEREYGGVPVVEIADHAFAYCARLKTIVIEGAKKIGEGAFRGCANLSSVVLGRNTVEIGESAFWGCSALTSFDIPDSVTKVGYQAFAWCTNLASVTIPDNVSGIGSLTFWGCEKLLDSHGFLILRNTLLWYKGSDAEVAIPDGVTEISGFALENCKSLQSVVIPGSVKAIGDCAFRDCSNLTSIAIADGVQVIGDGAFEDCTNLVTASIPKSITEIGEEAFKNCRSLTSISIPSGVAGIKDKTFFSCESLTSVDIPDTVKEIGYDAFGCCSNLASISIPKSVEKIDDDALPYSENLTVLCPKRSSAWKFCANHAIPVKALDDSPAPGFFGRLFGRK